MAERGDVVSLDGYKIKDLRIANGFASRRALALAAVVAPGVVDNAENGRPVKIKSAERIAKKLGTTVFDLRNDLVDQMISNGTIKRDMQIYDDDIISDISKLLDNISVMHGLLKEAIERFESHREIVRGRVRREIAGFDQQMQPQPGDFVPPPRPFVLEYEKFAHVHHPFTPEIKPGDTCVFYRNIEDKYQLFLLATDSIPFFFNEKGWASVDLPYWVVSLAEIDAEPSLEMIGGLERAYGEHAYCGKFTERTPTTIDPDFSIHYRR